MDKIKQLLQEQGKQIADSAIQAKLKQYGIPEGSISEDDAKTIADELAPQAQTISGLAVSNGNSAPAEQKPKATGRGRKSGKQVTLEKAMIHAAKETETELVSMEDNIRHHKGQYVNYRSESLLNEIRNTSTEIVEALTDKLMEEKADAETFQQIGNQLGAGLFPLI
jgi:hypothetical protein